jgi:hypothetical protein
MISAPTQAKILLVDVDALYGQAVISNEELPPVRELLILSIPALEKAYSRGWSILFWSHRSRSQQKRLIDTLQQAKLWDLTDPQVDDPLLLRFTPSDEEPGITKLTLLENYCGRILDECSAMISIIEADTTIAQRIQVYGGKRVRLHTAPQVWMNMVAIDPNLLDEYLGWRCPLEIPKGEAG